MKAGWKTTEFWVTTLTIVGLVTTSLVTSLVATGALPATWAAVASGIAAAAYAISRGLAKFNAPHTPGV